MAVATTGAIYKSLIFDDIESRNFGVYITGEAVYNAPARDVEMVSIPGRNGAFALDKGRFENIEVTYPAGIFADNEADFARAVSDFRNYLCSRKGYCRLTDGYNPDEYRMAIYKSGLEVTPAQLKAGEFTIVFDCKPQRWLTSGEDAVTIGEWGETETASGSIATFEGDEATGIKSLVVDIEPIQDLNGYDKPWVGGAGKNKLPYPYYDNSQTKNGITYTVNSDGTVVANGTATAEATFYFLNNQSLASIGLTSGTYVLNGCPSGGSSSTYRIQIRQNGAWREETGSGLTFTYDASSPVNDLIRIDILSGATVNDIVFKPMIRLSSVSDATYEPYENICPISGYDSVVTSVAGKNLLPTRTDGYTNTTNGVTATFNSDGSVTLNGTATATAIWNLISNTASDNRLYLPQGDYILNGESVNNNNFWIGAYKNADSGTWPISSKTNGGAFTVASGDYIFPRIRIGSGVVLNNVTIYPMIRLASETDDTYEPYNGNTYTTNLSSTRYGGTLDVVSGVLTVTYISYTFNGTQTVTDRISAQNRIYVQLADMLSFSGYGDDLVKCNRLPKSATVSSDAETPPAIVVGYNNNYVYMQGVKNINASITDLASLNAWLSNNPVTFTYPLATPTTVQLTAQQVSALVGTNNVWANSGDVTVEYGTAPNMLVNPTLFESSPLLAVEGYGTIGFNGYEIELDNAVLGDIQLAAGSSSRTKYDTKQIAINTTNLNANDAIYVQGDLIISEDITPAGSTHAKLGFNSVTSSTNVKSAYGTESGTLKVSLTIVPDLSVGFIYGTASTITSSATYSYRVITTSTNYSETISVSVAYDGANTITITTTRTGTLPANVKRQDFYSTTFPPVYGYSTQSLLGDPTYIDCDLGEAYRIDGDTITSLNQHIDLGSDLPKFTSGINEITYDNTITDLKIQPRWWKV